MKSVLRSGGALWLAILLAASGAVAQEQEEGASFLAERLRPSIDRSGIIDVEWGGIEANPYEYDVALVGNYALNPLVVNLRGIDGSADRLGPLIAHRFTTSLVGAFTIFDWLQVGGELPLLVLQSRDALPGVPLGNISGIGIADSRLLAKVALLKSRDAGVDVAFVPTLTIPTGFPQNSYFGEGFFTFVPELAVSRELFGFRMAGNVGARFRPETDTFGLTVSHELLWRFGLGYRFATEIPFELDASINGATALLRPLSGINKSPLEVLGGASVDVIPDFLQVFAGVGVGVIAGFATPDLRVYAGVRLSPRSHDRDGDGIEDSDDDCPDDPEDKDGFEDQDGCPDPDNDGDGVLDGDDRCPDVPGLPERKGCLAGDSDGDGLQDAEDACPFAPEDKDGFQDEDGCPDPDNDNDGILDVDDQCPNDPEDLDGYEDIDGCPEPDNDGDEILDGEDECPNEPEDMDGDKDEDGCPDEARIVVTKKKVFVLEKIYFDFGKASIKGGSLPVVDEIAKVLTENPQIGRVRIEGHTDSKGPEAFNLRLSQARTDSVRKALVARGVPADRLESKGFGEARPVATNETAAGREQNRRVEFVLIDMAPPP